MEGSRIPAAVVFAAVALSSIGTNAHALSEAGHVLFATGSVRLVAQDGTERTLLRGDAVAEGQTIVTGAQSHAQLRMADDALIAVRPDTSLRIEAYRFEGRETGDERGVIGLLKGGFRSITGLIGLTNKENYRVRAATANIGIRGTDHETFLIQEAPNTGAANEAGVYNRVNLGGTYIEVPGGRIELSANEIGFVGLQVSSVPVRLQETPAFMRVTGVQQSSDQRHPVRPAAALLEPTLIDSAISAGQPSAAVLPLMPNQALTSETGAISGGFAGSDSTAGGFGRGGRFGPGGFPGGGPCGGPCGKAN